VPVVLRGNPTPELPEKIERLAFLDAITIDHDTFDSDFGKLLDAVRRYVRPPSVTRRVGGHLARAAVGGLVGNQVAWLLVMAYQRRTSSSENLQIVTMTTLRFLVLGAVATSGRTAGLVLLVAAIVFGGAGFFSILREPFVLLDFGWLFAAIGGGLGFGLDRLLRKE